MNESEQPRRWYSGQPLDQRKSWYSSVAAAYHRVRPRYPQEIIDRAVEWAHLPPHADLLEIGCGPGIATASFAQLGFSMVCLEPSYDAYLLARQTCESYSNVDIINTTFEEWELKSERFDAVLAATSFHWVSPEIAYPKAATALRHTGSLILLWNMMLQPSYEVYQALEEVYQTHAPSLGGYETRAIQAENLKKFEQIVLNSGWFKDVVTDYVSCEVTYSVDDYLALLSTYSPYIALEPSRRERLFQELGNILNQVCGEEVPLSYLSALQLASKSGPL